MSRALSVHQIYTTKRNLLQFTGQWLDSIGSPELTGAWMIWAGSGHGKTTFVLQLCKYLTKFTRVLYNSLEEGNSESLKLALQQVKMEEVDEGRIIFLDQEPIADMLERLRKHKAPKVVVIDSWQYADMNLKQYKAMLREFRHTLFIIVSHAEGREPEGKVAKKIRYDAFVKIHIEGYKAFVKGRYLRKEGPPIIIWEEGALKYHGEI